MKVLCGIIRRVVERSDCYENRVKFEGNSYSNFSVHFNLSSYGWCLVRSDKRVSVNFYVDKTTDLGMYRNIVGMTKILDRIKLLCIKENLICASGSVLVYPTCTGRFYISVLHISVKYAFQYEVIGVFKNDFLAEKRRRY